jgi:D-alanine-D-alanine ligase
MARLRVAVVFGGRSGEHEVSLASAESIMSNLDPDRYEVVPIGIRKDGRWIAGPDPLAALKEPHGSTNEPLLALVPGAAAGALVDLRTNTAVPKNRVALDIDVVFPVLHGPFGEDGTIQGLLELAGVPYVGAGVLASAVSMDKAMMKTVWQARGLPIAAFEVVRRADLERQADRILDCVETRFGFPCFVKPANLGSSVGVHKARTRSELMASLEDAARYDGKLLVEEAISARELECSVLGNEEPRASVVGEIVPVHEFYDYRAKYVDEGSELHIPADISPEAADEVRRLAVEAFRAVDASGMARVDFFLERQTGRVLLNEINTIPGFTRISMYPKLWEASGLAYRALLDELIRLALDRHADRARNVSDYRPD